MIAPLPALDWTRMAEPQADQYDTEAALHLFRTTTSPLRREPYVRRPVGAEAAICDGEVAVRYTDQKGMGPPRFANAAVDHPHLAQAAGYVRRWPAAYQQFKRLIDTVHPLTDVTIPAAQLPVHLGSASHSEEAQPGAIFATVDNALCLAQSMVHEMAHQKLRALGVSIESATRLILNDPAQLLDSPIRKDKKRPMTAVFHAQYTFIYVTCLDLHMLEDEADPQAREHILMLLARNVPRMEAGMEEIDRHIRTDAAGEVFVGSFRSWATEVIRRGNQVLDAHGYGMPALS